MTRIQVVFVKPSSYGSFSSGTRPVWGGQGTTFNSAGSRFDRSGKGFGGYKSNSLGSSKQRGRL